LNHAVSGASESQFGRSDFANKEAIVAAIVARELERLLTLTAEVQAAENMLEALALRTATGVLGNLDPHAAGLKLEIVAEASRNPTIAEIVRAADSRRSAGLEETLQGLAAGARPCRRRGNNFNNCRGDRGNV
jgi:TetR/AcrR family transcriptional repressor of uid operon